MAVAGWLLDKSAAARADDPAVAGALAELAGELFVCPVGALEQPYSARSARDYDDLREAMEGAFGFVDAAPDVFARALDLQRDLAHHHVM